MSKRKFQKMSSLIKCQKLEKLYSQDIIKENLSFKRTLLTNYALKDGQIQENNQLHQLLAGTLLASLTKAINNLDKHFSDSTCSTCQQHEAERIKTCHSCGKKPFKVYNIEEYRQCKSCKAYLHSQQKCMLKHVCTPSK